MKTIKRKIFLSYMLIIVAISATISGMLGIFMFTTLRENTYASLESIIDSQMNNLDKEIANMDTLALNILYSPVTRETFVRVPEDAESQAQWAGEISQMMTAFASPTFPVAHIMLYDFYGHAVGTDSNQMRNIDIKENIWFDEIMRNDRYLYLTIPYSGLDPKANQYKYTISDLISLYRIVYDQYGIARGVVEVKQYYSKIFKELDDYAKRDTYTSVIVLNEKGEQVYPLDLLDSQDKYFLNAVEKEGDNNRVTLENSAGEKVLMSYKVSDKTNWMLCITWDYNRVLSSVYEYLLTVGVVVLFITVIALINAYYVSVQIAHPIERLRYRIKHLDVNNTLPENDCKSKILEIEAANNTLEQVSKKLTKTVNSMLQSQQHELQAKMLALQSQMNPHFLYNSLAVICALAEEHKTDQIVYMCKNISGMLRYIASSKCNLVTVQEEMEHTRQYLDCMKIRYGEYLSFTLDIPENIAGQLLPKLSIQPLVENSIKSCTCCEAPWNISVTGYADNGLWKISVSDNGNGFTEEEVSRFYGKIKDIENRQTFPLLELGGMGLVNVYMRLKLHYEEKMFFQMRNIEPRGASVTIGGSISELCQEEEE